MKIDSFTRIVKAIFRKYYAVIVIVLVIAVLLSGYLIFIKEQMSEIQRIGVVDLKVKQEERQVKQEALKRLEALKGRYQQISSDELRQLGYLLPRQADIPYLVIELKNFVKNNNVILDSLEVGPLGTAPTTNQAPTAAGITVKTLTITLSIQGLESYVGLKNFLDELSLHQPLLELTSLSYAPSSDSYSLNLTTYYQ